jgi:hypothetical protein
VPLRVPRLLASAIDPGSGASGLLWAAYSALLAPQAWQPTDYLELARQLAQLHAAFWTAAEQLAVWDRLRPPAMGRKICPFSSSARQPRVPRRRSTRP